MQSLTRVQKELYDWLVEYIHEHQHPPSIRQMMEAMHLRSPAPVQSRLRHLQSKGYIDWEEGKARTLKLLHDPLLKGLPIHGEIAAGELIEPITNDQEKLDIGGMLLQPDCYALLVNGDSMIEEMIAPGDYVIMRRIEDPDAVRNGTIVAAWVEGWGSTLKRFYRKSDQVTLEAANPKYPPIRVSADDVRVQGCLVGVWRTCVKY
ncbi:MAG: transcriptional repressor LexA [Prochlorotrichaceae cyanobacterium]|jgi:repressor LexA